MNYDDQRPANSGDTKLSEVAVDKKMPLDDTSQPQSNALLQLQAAMQAIVEVARKSTFILRSNGNIFWSGSEIRFDDSAQANDAILEILGSEGSVNPSFQLKMAGTTGANGPTSFLNLPMADGDMLYFELNSSLLIDQGTLFNVNNAVNGGGTTVGLRLLKTTVAAGLPKIKQSPTGGTIFNIPLAIRRGTDIWWVPHGIRWPSGTASTLGAVIVEGITPWPTNFVENEAQLDQAITLCGAAGGGIILIKGGFSITTPKVIPANTKLLGRGGGSSPAAAFQAINVVNGASITFSNAFSGMECVQLTADSTFTGTMVTISSNACTFKECNFDMTACTDVGTNIAVALGGTNNRMYRNFIRGTNTNRIGISYTIGATGPNTDVDTMFY
jgi:hypothetical protein